MQKFFSHPLQLVISILLVLLVSLALFNALMRPPASELEHMAVFLAFTATISLLAGYGAYRLGWFERAPSLRWMLLGTYVLAILLTFINVWLTARLMFASQHDLLLATILLLFAGGIAVGLGSFFASTLTDRISRLESATHAIETGDLTARADIAGKDEIASLSNSFNRMADRLQAADLKQKELDVLRQDLIAWAGHDLRTPLSSIRLLVEALADGVVNEPDTVQQYLHQAKKQVDQLSGLVDDLFQVSQLDAGGLRLYIEPASMTDLLSDTLESFTAQAEQLGITLTGSAAAGIDPIQMDVQRMGRVFNNLISNALHHTQAGGAVTINAESIPGGVIVSIQDTGEGIFPEDLPHVFDRFYRGDKSRNRAQGGAGLGLAIARGIVEAHQGTIRVESQRSQGTVFTITLPKP